MKRSDSTGHLLVKTSDSKKKKRVKCYAFPSKCMMEIIQI